jgi:phosphinothricin acetyltransferase
LSATIRPASPADLPGILAIYNDAVVNSVAIWNDAVADLDNRRSWYEARLRQNYPVLVADDGEVVAYASFGDFRAFDGYRFTVELSVYVAKAARRRGIASALITALAGKAKALGKHVMVAGIAGENVESIRLHERLGFVESGRMPEVGYKFGRWLDLVFMQRKL